MVIKWKEEYSCFDTIIDQQHKKMIDLINQMNEISVLDDGCDQYDEILAVFEELKDYTVYHFNYEEELFDQKGYDSFNIKIQKLEHKSFIKMVTGINLHDLDENQTETIRELLGFLSMWLDQHILVMDKKFGKFIEDNVR